MTKATSPIALCSAMPVPASEAGSVPEWVHLLPAGEIRTVDGRGPYRIISLQAIADTLKPGERLPIDECHSTDRAVPLGNPAPARGWIVELQARQDGLWGKVEWTGTGRQLMEDRAYRGLSPAVLHDHQKNVLGVLRASLVNNPNLKGLTSLHSEENDMDLKGKLIGLLKLDSEADDDAVFAAVSAKMNGGDDKPALHSVIESEPYVALQSQLADTTTQLTALQSERLRDKAEAYVDAALAEGRAGLNQTTRELYISLHMENAERATALIGAMPKLAGQTHAGDVPSAADDSGLSAADRQVIALMGLSEDEYKESLAASGKKMEAL